MSAAQDLIGKVERVANDVPIKHQPFLEWICKKIDEAIAEKDQRQFDMEHEAIMNPTFKGIFNSHNFIQSTVSEINTTDMKRK